MKDKTFFRLDSIFIFFFRWIVSPLTILMGLDASIDAVGKYDDVAMCVSLAIIWLQVAAVVIISFT